MAENISKIILNGTEYVIKDAATQYHTINGQSITGGTGDIVITGGSGLHKWEGTRAEYNALSSYDADTLYIITDEDVEIPVVPTKVSAFENDAGYLTQHQDISNLATKTELSNKQDALVSGTNVKTINGQSLLGSGDIATVPVTTDNVNYTNSSSTKTLTQVLNNTEEITFTLEDGSTVTKKFILG